MALNRGDHIGGTVRDVRLEVSVSNGRQYCETSAVTVCETSPCLHPHCFRRISEDEFGSGKISHRLLSDSPRPTAYAVYMFHTNEVVWLLAKGGEVNAGD
jgi:hypothetical protein